VGWCWIGNHTQGSTKPTGAKEFCRNTPPPCVAGESPPLTSESPFRVPFGELESRNTESRDPRVNEPGRELYLSAFFVYPYGVKGFATTTAIAAALSFRKSEISTPDQTQGFGSGC